VTQAGDMQLISPLLGLSVELFRPEIAPGNDAVFLRESSESKGPPVVPTQRPMLFMQSWDGGS
jgi:hypothetical protein